jgi:hypothetical protein
MRIGSHIDPLYLEWISTKPACLAIICLPWVRDITYLSSSRSASYWRVFKTLLSSKISHNYIEFNSPRHCLLTHNPWIITRHTSTSWVLAILSPLQLGLMLSNARELVLRSLSCMHARFISYPLSYPPFVPRLRPGVVQAIRNGILHGAK